MLKYRREIDGLRAIAVLTVIFYHAGFQEFSGGFIGVDIFFVISGYLISSIIFKEVSLNTFTIKNFYERRARRILPALFFVVLLSIPLSFAWMLPADMLDFSQSLIATPLFISNFLFFIESGYFDAAIEVKPLFHTWSLAVEEQFYIIFPIFIITIWRFGFKIITISIVVLFFVSLMLAEFTLSIDRMLSFYMLPTRIWELLLGSIIAILQYKNIKISNNHILSSILGTIGLILIFTSIVIFDKNSPMPGYFTLIPTIGAGLIIMFASNITIVGKFLGNKFLVGIGLVSYSAYLWHQPLFAFVRIYRFGDVKPGMYASAILITFILAFMTWKFIENPFRNKSKIKLKLVVTGSIFASLLLVIIGISGVVTNGFEEIYKNKLTSKELIYFKNAQEITKIRNLKDRGFNYPKCYIKYSKSDSFKTKFNKCIEIYGPAIVTMGDSHMDNLRRSLTHTKQYNFIVSIGTYHCHAYHYYEKNSKNECDLVGAIKFLNSESSNINYLIYNQLGSYFIVDKNKVTLNNINVQNVKETMLYINIDRIKKTIDYFQNVTNNINVVWLSSWTEALYPMHNPRKVAKYTDGDIDYIPTALESFGLLEDSIKNILKQQKSKIIFVSLFDAVNKKSLIPLINNDCVTFNDTNHLSTCGEKVASIIFEQEIKASLAK